METIEDNWAPAVCGSYYLNSSSGGCDGESNNSFKVKLNISWDELEQKFNFTCNDFLPKILSCSLSVDSLKTNHEQLVLAHPELDKFLPRLPETCASIYKYDYFPSFCDTSSIVNQNLCKSLERYLDKAMSIAGQKTVLLLLFDDDPLADFDENVQEIRGKGLRNQMTDCVQQLNEVTTFRQSVTQLDELATVYMLEDEVITNLNIALFELFNFKISPFHQLREMSEKRIHDLELKLKILQKKSKYNSLLEEQNLITQLHELRQELQVANESLHQLYEEFYRQSTEIIFAQLNRMYKDGEQLGLTTVNTFSNVTKYSSSSSSSSSSSPSSSSSSSSSPSSSSSSPSNDEIARKLYESRLLKLEIYYLQEKLKCLNVNKIQRLFDKERVKTKLDELSSKNSKLNSVFLEKLSLTLKTTEIKIIDIRIAILNEEESLLKKQISYLERQEKDESAATPDPELLVCYALDDLCEFVNLEEQFDLNLEKSILNLDYFRVKLRSLARKRAVYRTKRKLFVEEKKHNLSKNVDILYQANEQNTTTTTTTAGDSSSMATNLIPLNENREEFLRKSRQKALQRLRSFRLKQKSLYSLNLNSKLSYNCGGFGKELSNNTSNADLNSIFDSDFSSFSSSSSATNHPTTLELLPASESKHNSMNSGDYGEYSLGSTCNGKLDSDYGSEKECRTSGLFVKRSAACEDCSANDSLSLVEENAELQTQPFLSLRPDLNSPSSKPLVAKGSLITTKVLNFCAAKVNTISNSTGGGPTSSHLCSSFNSRTPSLKSSSPSPTSPVNSSSFTSPVPVQKLIVGLPQSPSSPFANKSLGYSSLRVKTRESANSFLLMGRSIDPQHYQQQQNQHHHHHHLHHEQQHESHQLQQQTNALEEFQRIRSTLRKSVRRATPVRTTTETKEESLEPGRKELDVVFQKIRNIKIG